MEHYCVQLRKRSASQSQKCWKVEQLSILSSLGLQQFLDEISAEMVFVILARVLAGCVVIRLKRSLMMRGNDAMKQKRGGVLRKIFGTFGVCARKKKGCCINVRRASSNNHSPCELQTQSLRSNNRGTCTKFCSHPNFRTRDFFVAVEWQFLCPNILKCLQSRYFSKCSIHLYQ